MDNNATGDGMTLEQVAKLTVGELLQTGRFGLLGDYPVSEQGLSAVQVSALRLQANIKTYQSESILNWKTETIGGQTVLSLVVLAETYEVPEDEFKSEIKRQYRVLKLVENTYVVEVWRDDEVFTTAEPRDAKGNRLSFIPFVIAGTYSNDPDIDDAALYDLAEINIGHYRNSADYEEGVFLHGQPMLHIDIGTTNTTEWNDLNPNGVEVGARRGLVTSGSGSAQLLQTQANSAAFEAMSHKEKQMVAIGARTIEQGQVPETLGAVVIKYAGDNSVLSNVVQNASSAMETVLTWCGLFMGVDSPIEYKINETFYDYGVDPNQIMAEVQLFDRQILGVTELRGTARKMGMIDEDRTDEIIDAEMTDLSPIE
jgi:hypothetical protein